MHNGVQQVVRSVKEKPGDDVRFHMFADSLQNVECVHFEYVTGNIGRESLKKMVERGIKG